MHPAPSARLADGVELIGKYAGSGLENPIFLARRADGQMVQMSSLLYAVATRLDGRRDAPAIAAEVSEEFGRELSAEDVAYLVESKLRPTGIVASDADGAVHAVRRTDAMLGLNFRARVVPAGVVAAATRVAWPLFLPPFVLASLFALGFLDSWLLFAHGVAQGVREVVLRPELSLVLFGLLLVSTAFHELGHATACRYGGARPGPVGVGLYLAWPVFYSDVTDSYRLDRGGRLRTDLGGVYFNVLFALAVAGAYLVTHFEPLVVLVVLQQIEILHQFFPFVRLDGYYVVSDLIGVPDLFLRLRPALASLVPGRPLHPRIAELKPWARFAVAAWVLATVAVLAGLYVLLVTGLPRIIGTARESFLVHAAEIQAAWRAGNVENLGLGILQESLLLLPLVALALTLARALRALARVGWSYTQSQPALRAAVGVAAALAIGFAGGYLWQPSRYEPIQPAEHGTLPAAPAFVAPAPGGETSRKTERTGTVSTPSGAPAAAPSAGSSGSGSVSTAAPAPTVAPTPTPTVAPTPMPSPTAAATPLPSPT